MENSTGPIALSARERIARKQLEKELRVAKAELLPLMEETGVFVGNVAAKAFTDLNKLPASSIVPKGYSYHYRFPRSLWRQDMGWKQYGTKRYVETDDSQPILLENSKLLLNGTATIVETPWHRRLLARNQLTKSVVVGLTSKIPEPWAVRYGITTDGQAKSNSTAIGEWPDPYQYYDSVEDLQKTEAESSIQALTMTEVIGACLRQAHDIDCAIDVDDMGYLTEQWAQLGSLSRAEVAAARTSVLRPRE